MEIQDVSGQDPSIQSFSDVKRELRRSLLQCTWPHRILPFREMNLLHDLETKLLDPLSGSLLEKAEGGLPEVQDPELRTIIGRIMEKARARARSVPETGEKREEPEIPEEEPEAPEKEGEKGRVIPFPRKPKPEPEKPPPLGPSVGRKLKLKYIRADFWEGQALGPLRITEKELYRILATYRKIPGGNSLYSYIWISISQARGLLERRKKDLLKTARGKNREEAERIRTSYRSVQRAFQRLRERGVILRVVMGYCIKGQGGSGGQTVRVSKYLVVISDKQWHKLREDRKRGLGPWSKRR